MEAIDPVVHKCRPVIPGAIRLLASHEVIHGTTGNLTVLGIARRQARKERTGMDAGVVHPHVVEGRIADTQVLWRVYRPIQPRDEEPSGGLCHVPSLNIAKNLGHVE